MKPQPCFTTRLHCKEVVWRGNPGAPSATCNLGSCITLRPPHCTVETTDPDNQKQLGTGTAVIYLPSFHCNTTQQCRLLFPSSPISTQCLRSTQLYVPVPNQVYNPVSISQTPVILFFWVTNVTWSRIWLLKTKAVQKHISVRDETSGGAGIKWDSYSITGLNWGRGAQGEKREHAWDASYFIMRFVNANAQLFTFFFSPPYSKFYEFY